MLEMIMIEQKKEGFLFDFSDAPEHYGLSWYMNLASSDLTNGWAGPGYTGEPETWIGASGDYFPSAHQETLGVRLNGSVLISTNSFNPDEQYTVDPPDGGNAFVIGQPGSYLTNTGIGFSADISKLQTVYFYIKRKNVFVTYGAGDPAELNSRYGENFQRTITTTSIGNGWELVEMDVSSVNIVDGIITCWAGSGGHNTGLCLIHKVYGE